MRLEHLTIRAVTDGQNTTGQCKLSAQLFVAPVDYIVIPLGTCLKIRQIRAGGAVDTDFTVEYGLPTANQWNPVTTAHYVASRGELVIDIDSPIVLYGRTGQEAIRVTWTQTTAGLAYLELEVDITTMDE